jgi:hypothetical protein
MRKTSDNQDRTQELKSIAVPERSKQRMMELLRTIEAMKGQLASIELGLRDGLGVPDSYELIDLNEGFVPTAAQEAMVLPTATMAVNGN